MRSLATNAYKVWKATGLFAGIFLTANMLIIIANIIMRRFFNSPIYGSTEIVSYLSLITASFALAQNEWFDGNIRMSLVIEILPHKLSQWLIFIDYIICSVAFVYVSYLLGDQAVRKYATGDISTDLGVPLYIFSSVLALGFAILTVCIIIKTLVYGYAAFTGEEISFRYPSGTEEKPLE